MASKFQSLVKLKQQKIEELSSKIAELGRMISQQHEMISVHKNDFLNRQIPTEGSVAFFAQQQLLNIAFKQELNSLENRLREMMQQETELQETMRLERIELEKYTILHQEEVQKALKAARKKEADFLDEMGSVRFANNRSAF